MTDKYYSASSKPGTFGKTMYNAAFKELGIDATYEPLAFQNAKEFLYWVGRNSCNKSAKGVSVSMPFKKIAWSRCDFSNSPVKNINTIKFTKEGNVGHNTDIDGFRCVMKGTIGNSRSAVIFGVGAVSESIQCVLNSLQIPYNLVTRDNLPKLRNDGQHPRELLINATPIGMSGIPDDIFTKELLETFKCVFDVVVSKEPTNLIKNALELGLPCQTGSKMSINQLIHQFEIYTGVEAPIDLFRKLLDKEGYFYV